MLADEVVGLLKSQARDGVVDTFGFDPVGQAAQGCTQEQDG
jgi:hypothetical protein